MEDCAWCQEDEDSGDQFARQSCVLSSLGSWILDSELKTSLSWSEAQVKS